MGAKLALVMFVLMCAMGGGVYWYYNDTQERIAILTENNVKLETAVETNEQALAAQTAAFKSMQKQNEKLQKEWTEINNECWRTANPNFDPNIQSDAWKRKNL